jgi:hypothetical protein
MAKGARLEFNDAQGRRVIRIEKDLFTIGCRTGHDLELKHYMNVTCVSRPTPEDRPADEELFGEFNNSEIF